MDPYDTYTDKQLFEFLAKTRKQREMDRLLKEIIRRYEKPLATKLRLAIPYDDDLIGLIVNDVFIDVWRKRRKLASVESPRAWLLKVLSFKMSDAIQKVKGREEYLDFTTSDYLEIPENHPDFDEERYEGMVQKIQRAVANMPVQRRVAFAMRVFDGLSIAGIARLRNLNEQTVKNHVGLVKQQLRKMFRKGRKEGYK
ncbi:RNA polymerase sigma factor [Parapedobacter indicus]|uniref:RNA polymerase sigma factor, sigma-70 family n=1 Tax=Parapedobacter indicus TaxID=1477437 RepID=A0A1I3IRK9_9SPHI|nr:sigma factor-like helix-turn-helix DNA-binding protein [Parapedobacter indicus]PPL02268.1 RNA polymerase sigma factor (sigma-70 family) [Parapedobacter indicus]SFI50618.1 RNA polymerase sigma factor, sigma-70 family [Parapedobacter indicus]